MIWHIGNCYILYYVFYWKLSTYEHNWVSILKFAGGNTPQLQLKSSSIKYRNINTE